MIVGANWSTPAELRHRVKRLWDRGVILASLVTGEPLFPKRLPIRGPTSSQLTDSFDEVRRWALALRAMRTVRLEEREFRHRLFGANSLPRAAWLDGLDDAVALLGKTGERVRFEEILDVTRVRQPALLAWLAKRPLAALDYADNWGKILDVVAWLQVNPRPGIYIRQMDVPGVHSKFIEKNRAILSGLLDCALPATAIDPDATGVRQFERRYGFKAKPERIRYRMLDPAVGRVSFRPQADIEVDATTFAILDPGVSQVFVTENEINFLTFPDVPESMVIFGAGYGFESLGRARWLTACRLLYWGDIDTHGFAILDQLRAQFPHVESFLMDRDTLVACQEHWGRENSPVKHSLARLNAEEMELYEELRNDYHGESLRLEQERIGFGYLRKALRRAAR